jgi:hypothetical protein
MAYIYRSRVGSFSIRPDEANPGTVELCLGGMWLCNYESAEDAAAAVCRRETGWHEWDCLDDPHKPNNLSDWEQL